MGTLGSRDNKSVTLLCLYPGTKTFREVRALAQAGYMLALRSLSSPASHCSQSRHFIVLRRGWLI